VRNTWFISDTHFGHEKCCTTFKRDDGSPLRPFRGAWEMDEALIERWNEVVKPEDKVYHLGDVAIKKENLAPLARCNGSKRLIRGNHDIFPTKDYLTYFKEIYGVRVLTEHKLILSHIPLALDCMPRMGWNVHGHLHANKMQHKAYINVSVEQIDYRPIHLDEVLAKRKRYPELDSGSKL
jgi:calcineurin-like phosphoesterase family protein